ncbi:zinc-dependent alcohol dehydrogenase family protein [Pseudomonas stutzeri]|uniref:zinc-dependent alcohol dehydrogenase family protein n=1 Tax=Stutzerimonas stutzeri TaxID=316 RepID=UPI001F41A4D5|nr:zinc-dependent alcohol dehydrogenase family protein [Stutzerimonas stutzeri]MCF0017013.1 zinc-dependent alcohol dehydrogenase family protein [Stutzerimonas stutzeri]MCF0020768.1 zinc-dependent alcohol dehydrogenase family protein [Stutzerimonas stutzeri]MDH0103037.1 zinc-dependent alcohol dehydrogenase family protein [Stutzerimonas stutzeri]MDH1590425.1 zinc-dependent alcohol dehydrogenase family protein [Stutzerimonas stutzeri]
MRAMLLEQIGQPLQLRELPVPQPGPGEVRVRVLACGVCRTDLHVVDGELPEAPLPIIPGHEIVGRVDALGEGVTGFELGQRVGIPWLGHTCGTCSYCQHAEENLCDAPQFTGYTRPGGYAEYVVADARFAFALGEEGDPVALAPLLCAGLIGWRSLVKAGDGKRLGLYGFGAAAHIVMQVARWQGRDVYAFSRPGDVAAQDFARSLGAVWAGDSGELVPAALRALRKGGRVVCAGIHMSDIPSFPYDILWQEREVVSVANLTRQDGLEFFPVAAQVGIHTETHAYPLEQANQALDDLRNGRFQGAAVLVP